MKSNNHYYLINRINGYAMAIDPSESLQPVLLSIINNPASLYVIYTFKSYKEAEKVRKDYCLSEPEWTITNYI